MNDVRRTVPWGVVLGAVVVLAVGGWIFWDLKPWVKPLPPGAKPASTVHILGRDDEATKKAEAELDAPASGPRRPPAPPPSGSAAPASSR